MFFLIIGPEVGSSVIHDGVISLARCIKSHIVELKVNELDERQYFGLGGLKFKVFVVGGELVLKEFAYDLKHSDLGLQFDALIYYRDVSQLLTTLLLHYTINNLTAS
jgi:hypothetical protein